MITQLTPAAAAEMIKTAKVRLIDVRETWEYDLAHIAQSELMPMSIFPRFLPMLGKDEKLIIVCHHGVRSNSVCEYLEDNGYDNLFNLSGGIDAWSKEVDPSVPLY